MTGIPHFFITAVNRATKKSFGFTGAQESSFIVNSALKLLQLAKLEEKTRKSLIAGKL